MSIKTDSVGMVDIDAGFMGFRFKRIWYRYVPIIGSVGVGNSCRLFDEDYIKRR